MEISYHIDFHIKTTWKLIVTLSVIILAPKKPIAHKKSPPKYLLYHHDRINVELNMPPNSSCIKKLYI